MALKQNITLLLLLPFICFSQQDDFDKYYKKATVATFYSSTVYNSYNELNLAIKYLDSAKSKLDISSEHYSKNLFKIETLEKELETSRVIAIDNLNYRIPGFSVITRNRSDLNLIDDAQELLLEFLTENHLSQADPLLKGTLNQNTHFFLINIKPFDETLLGVILDYLSINSGHYAIRPHEISAILDTNGFDRYKNDSLLQYDYQKILAYYNIDRIYNFTFEDKGSILENLFYWGATLNTIDKTNPKKTFWKYFENFKKDKSESLSITLITLLLCVILTFIILRVYDVRKNLNFKIRNYIQKDYLYNDVILIFAAIISLGISYYLGSFISPAANAYHNEILSNIWVLYQVFIIPLLIFIILLLTSIKFGKIAATSIENLRKIIFCSFGFPYLSLIILNQFSSWNQTQNFYEAPITIFLLIIPSHITANYFLPIIRGKNTPRDILVVLLSLALFLSAEYNLLTQNYLYSNIFLVLLVFSLLIYRLFTKGKDLKEEISEKKIKDNLIDENSDIIRQGFNYDDYENALEKLIKSDTSQLLNVFGTKGIGKKTIASKIISNLKVNLFELDFSNIEPGYEAFKICFKEKNNSLNLPENFFSSPISFKKLSESISSASEFLPINILKSININDDDEIISARELAADLVNNIVESSQKDSCLLISNINDISSENWSLLHQLILRLSSKRTLNNFKIIILSDDEIFNYKDEISEIFDGRDSHFKVICTDVNSTINHFLSKMDFSNQFNEFILDEVAEIDSLKFSLGKVIKLINELDDEGYLNKNSNKIGLINHPPPKFKLENNISFLIEEFSKLNSTQKSIIESASLIGFEFDTSILSYILNQDVLDLLSILEKLEKIGFIRDDLNNEGVFKFQSIAFYNWLVEKVYNNPEKKSTQKTLEIQKRLIESLSINAQYINVKILENSLNKILRLKNQNSLVHKIEKLLLISINTLSKNNLFEDLDFYFKNYLSISDKITNEDLETIIFILNKTIQSKGSLEIYESQAYSGKTIIDELIFDFYKNAESSTLLTFFEVVLKDLVRRSFQINNNSALESRLKNLNSKIDSLKIESIRCKFYQLKIEKNRTKGSSDITAKLETLAKLAVEEKDFQLTSEIFRDLSIQYKNVDNDKMLYCILNSLNYFFDKPLNIDVKTKDFEKISKVILDLLTAKQTKEQAENLSYSINRLMDYFSITKKFKNVFELSNYNIALNQKIKDHRGITISYCHRGKSMYDLKQHQNAIQSYSEYFEYLSDYFNLRVTAIDPSELNPTDISHDHNTYWLENELTPILEGILFNCNAIKEYNPFFEMKKELLRNNIIISSKILENKLYWYDNKKTIKDLLPKIDKYDTPNKFSKLLIQGFLLLSKSDGDISDQEFYNSVEYVNALQLITDQALVHNQNQFKDIFDNTNKLTTNQVPDEFVKVCNQIHEDHTIDTFKRFYFSLLKISYSDYKLFNQEITLLNIAKSFISSEQ